MKAKKLIVGAALSMFLFSIGTANAATKQDVINALKSAGANSAILTMAENYLKTTNLSSDKLDAVVKNINDVKAIMDAKGVKDVTKLSKEDKDKILAEVADTAKIVGLNANVVVGKDGKRTISLTNDKGKTVAVVAGNGNVMKKTATTNALGMAVGSITATAGLVAIRKRK